MRKAFGIWMALMIILLISGMMVVVLKYASISAKHISDSYIREQAELYLNSVVEKALLDISAYDRTTNGNCWAGSTYNIPSNHGKEYTAKVDVITYYLLAGSTDAGLCGGLTTNVQTEESHGYVVMNVEVNATVDGKIKARIIRRTLQRP